MLIPSGIVPQLQIGRHIPVSVVHKSPEIRVEPMADFFIFSGPTNSWTRPATRKLNSIHAEALLSILIVEAATSEINCRILCTVSRPLFSWMKAALSRGLRRFPKGSADRGFAQIRDRDRLVDDQDAARHHPVLGNVIHIDAQAS